MCDISYSCGNNNFSGISNNSALDIGPVTAIVVRAKVATGVDGAVMEVVVILKRWSRLWR